MYKWAGKQVYEPLPPLNGHYSIHSVNVSNQAEFGGGKTKALGVKTTADPRGTTRTNWAARGKPSHPLDRRYPPTLPSAELPPTEEIRRTEENLEDHDTICLLGPLRAEVYSGLPERSEIVRLDHDYIGRTTVKALRVHTTILFTFCQRSGRALELSQITAARKSKLHETVFSSMLRMNNFLYTGTYNILRNIIPYSTDIVTCLFIICLWIMSLITRDEEDNFERQNCLKSMYW